MELLISIENFEVGDNIREINSPRTLEACLRSGLDPQELYPKSRSAFVSRKLTKEMIDIKFETFERKRRDKIQIVKTERTSIIYFGDRTRGHTFGSQSFGEGFANTLHGVKEKETSDSAMIEMEERRIEALRRRQERELSKMIEREQALANLQSKIKKAEDEEQAKKKQHEKKVAEQKVLANKRNIQRLADLAKQEEQDAIRRRKLAKKDTEFDKKMKILAMEADKKMQDEARQRDRERAGKLEEYKRKTEALLQAQVEQAESNRAKMVEREMRVQEQLTMKMSAKKEQSAQQKEKAMKRIAEALEKHHQLHDEKKKRFEESKREAYERAKEAAKAERDALKKQADEREKRNKMRMTRLVESFRSRTSHREEVEERRLEKDKNYDRVKAERDDQIAMAKFLADLKMQDKLENVERVARVNEFQRLQTIQRLHEEETRYESIQRQKKDMLRRHREEQKLALSRKHDIAYAMETMRVTNDFSLLDKLFASKSGKSARDRERDRDKKTGRMGMGAEGDGDDDNRIGLAQTV